MIPSEGFLVCPVTWQLAVSGAPLSEGFYDFQPN
jgi:hypothetical protein